MFAGAAHAACPDLQDQTTPKGAGGLSFAVASGLAYSTYIVQVSTGNGTAAIGNLAITANPGVQWSNGTKGFIGTGADIYVSYFVYPGATSGTYKDVNARIINTAGQVVCSDWFRIYVP